MSSEVENFGQKCSHTQTDQQLSATFRCHLYFLAQLSPNRMHIVGYQRQWRIHLCCLQKSIRWRYLRRQEVKPSAISCLS